MTREQRENLNYIGGKVSALKSVAENRDVASVLSDVLDTIVNMLETDEAVK